MGGEGHTGRRGSCAWRTLGDVVSTPAGGRRSPPGDWSSSLFFGGVGECLSRGPYSEPRGRSCRAGLGSSWALGNGAGIWELRGRAGVGVLSWGCEHAFLRKLYEPQLS